MRSKTCTRQGAGGGRRKGKTETPPDRSEQGSNLRGETPLDFKSNALTTRPSLLVLSLPLGCTLIGRSARRRPRPSPPQSMGAAGPGPAHAVMAAAARQQRLGEINPDSHLRGFQPETQRPCPLLRAKPAHLSLTGRRQPGTPAGDSSH